MKVFSKFGFEPTFYPKLRLPKELQSNNATERCYSVYYNCIEYNPRFFNLSDDDHVLETQTTREFINYTIFKGIYKKHVKRLASLHIYPSSLIHMEAEGGCHINFDLGKLRRDHDKAYVETFLENYRNYMTNNPSIAWMFLSPYDNVSSTLRFKDIFSYQKGDFFIARKSYCRSEYGTLETSGFKYLELRHFMMPRNNREFDVHFEFANALLLYINKRTLSLAIHTNRPPYYTGYTFDQAVKEFKDVCKEVGFDYKRVVGVGKLPLLRQRFSFGKAFLN